MSEEEVIEAFVEELLKRYDYTPRGVGQGLAFLYGNWEKINKLLEKN